MLDACGHVQQILTTIAVSLLKLLLHDNIVYFLTLNVFLCALSHSFDSHKLVLTKWPEREETSFCTKIIFAPRE